MKSEYLTRERLVDLVKAAGQDLIDNAENFVGSDPSRIKDFDIWVRFPIGEAPNIEVSKTYLGKNMSEVFMRTESSH